MYYARVVDSRVAEVIPPMFDEAGEYIPIELRYTPEFVRTCFPIPEGTVVVEGDSYVDGVFGPPIIPQPTPQEILDSQSAILVSLKQIAEAQKTALTNRVGTLNDAIELEMATPEEVAELPIRKDQLVEWKRYAVLLGRVTSQAGWPPNVDWPAQPAEGMDLSVSARASEIY